MLRLVDLNDTWGLTDDCSGETEFLTTFVEFNNDQLRILSGRVDRGFDEFESFHQLCALWHPHRGGDGLVQASGRPPGRFGALSGGQGDLPGRVHLAQSFETTAYLWLGPGIEEFELGAQQPGQRVSMWEFVALEQFVNPFDHKRLGENPSDLMLSTHAPRQ